MIAYELQAKFKAGLQLVGQDAEGTLEWMGAGYQWNDAHRLMNAFENEGTPILEQEFPF